MRNRLGIWTICVCGDGVGVFGWGPQSGRVSYDIEPFVRPEAGSATVTIQLALLSDCLISRGVTYWFVDPVRG